MNTGLFTAVPGTLSERAEAYRLALIDHVDLCDSVAFRLTADPLDAKALAGHVLAWAWLRRDTLNVESGTKMMLLTKLRETYIEYYRMPHEYNPMA